MAERSRLEELERRVAADPASIAFAQLAEEYRRAGRCDDAVRVSRGGLTHHPAYLSARVTLGRALLELEQFRDARVELERVVREAPDNLSAIRALAELHQRGGESLDDSTGFAAPDAPAADPPPAAPLAVTPADLDLSLPHSDDDLTRALHALDALDLHDLAGMTAPPVSFEPSDLDMPGALFESEFADGRSSFDPDAALMGIEDLTVPDEPMGTVPGRFTMWSPDVPAEPPSRHELDGTLDLLEPAEPSGDWLSSPAGPSAQALTALETWLEAIVSDRAGRS